MYRRPVLAASAVTLIVLGLGLGCASDSTGPGDGNTQVSWMLGDQESYAVTGNEEQSVFDPMTGFEFRFPEGGEGELTIAEITDGPDAPLEGVGFAVEFTGTTPIELVVDRLEEDEEITLLTFGAMDACYDDETAANDRWLAVPETESMADRVVFTLDAMSESSGGSLSKRAARTFTYHWMSRLTPSSTDAERRQAIRWQVQDFVTQFVGALSGTLKTRVDGEVKGRLKVRHDWDGLYYTGFWWRSLGASGRKVVPTIHLRSNSPTGTAAHETGHYLMHAMVGDDIQSTLEGQANLLSNHEIGDDNQRAKLVEEYAYFIEYFLTGTIASYDPENPYTMWGGLSLSPLTRDLPGHEGFGALMLSGLTRTGTTVQSLVRPSVMLPIPELSIPFGRAFDMMSQGATTINALRTTIQQGLSAAENEKWQVIMQRSGWQYSIKGTLVDKDDNPVQGVTVSNFMRAGGTVYEGGYSSIPTDKDGRFTISGEIFPGKSTLRCVSGSDTALVEITIDWDGATNQIVDIGSRTVDFDNILARLQARTRISVTVVGQHFGNYGEMVEDDRFSPVMNNVVWNGTSFSAMDASTGATYSAEHTISGSVSSDGKRILSLTYTYKWRENNTTPQAGILSSQTDTRVTITDINYTGEYFTSLRFALTGPDVGSHVALEYKRVVEWDDDEIGTTTTVYTHTAWDSTEITPSVGVYF